MISPEYTALLKSLLINGGKQNITYYYQSSFSFQIPTGLVVIAKNNGNQVAMANANIINIVEQGNRLSVTVSALFSTSFSANELILYAQYGDTLAYEIAYASIEVSSSSSSQLNVLWTIEYIVNDIFNVGLTINNVVSIPYMVHLLLAYTIIPNLAYTVQSNYPNLPLAQMAIKVPSPNSPTQFEGLTKCYLVESNGTVDAQFGVTNGQSFLFFSQSVQNVYVIGIYTLAGANIALMQSINTISANTGQLYKVIFGIDITTS